MYNFTRKALSLFLVIAMAKNAYAVSNSITEWDDGFDTGGPFTQANSGFNNTASFEGNDSLVTNLLTTPLLSLDTLNAMLVAIKKYKRTANNVGWSRLNSNLARGRISDDVINLGV